MKKWQEQGDNKNAVAFGYWYFQYFNITGAGKIDPLNDSEDFAEVRRKVLQQVILYAKHERDQKILACCLITEYGNELQNSSLSQLRTN